MAGERDHGRRGLQPRRMFQRHAQPGGNDDEGNDAKTASEMPNLGLDEDGGALFHKQRVVKQEMVHGERDTACEGELFGREASSDVHPSENRSHRDTVQLVALGRREHLTHANARAAGG